MSIEKSKHCKTAKLLPTEKQYAALCFRYVAGSEDPVQLLLITSRDTGRWVVPKGWGDAESKPCETAQREAWEEAGVVGRVRKKPFGYYTHTEKLSDEHSVMVVVQVHLLHVLDVKGDFPEKGQRTLRWFSPTAAASAVLEPDLKYLIGRLPGVAMQLLTLTPSVW
ncbi:NUDIX hydrolase [Rhizobium sp. BR 314]